jgi:lambda repressor-like predicted transcriptional regulator
MKQVRDIDRASGPICDGWNSSPADDAHLHRGSLAAWNKAGKTLMLCARCTRELDEMAAFMNRTTVGEKESVMQVTVSEGICFVRLSFRATIPVLDTKLLDEETRSRIPADAYLDPLIVMLHARMMRAALSADGITAAAIARSTRLPKDSVREYIDCKFPSVGTKHFFSYINWVIENEYTFNHLACRPDAAELMSGETSKLKGAAMENGYRSNVRIRLLAALAASGLSARKFAESIGVSRDAVNRAIGRRYWKQLSVIYWRQIEHALGRQSKLAQ